MSHLFCFAGHVLHDCGKRHLGKCSLLPLVQLVESGLDSGVLTRPDDGNVVAGLRKSRGPQV